jgi:hypothetical protein
MLYAGDVQEVWLTVLLCVLRCDLCADVANVIGKTLEVDNSILTAVLFSQYGMTIAWRLQGSVANELSYTVSSGLCVAVVQ